MKIWPDFLNAANHAILAWAQAQSWARSMASCQQDSEWHAEGDVWTHTKMVCAALEQLPEWHSLDRSEQLKLLFTALLHDSGKPATTALDSISGRIRSPNHAQVGEKIARQVLREIDCGVATRESICALVRHHGRPPYLLEKARPENEVISLSSLLNNRLLYLFVLADTRGRHSREMARPEENLHLWKMLAEERDCFETCFKFSNDQARFLFYRGQLSSLYYIPHENYRSHVTLMSGLPGAGKDTWLREHRPGLPVVALDAIREELDVEATDNQGTVIQSAREQCRKHLRAGQNFAFNATNTTRQIRQRWIDLFADYGARIEIVYIEPPLTTIFAQNKKRPNPVPEKVIERLVEKLEPPVITECHSLTRPELCS